MSGAVGEHVPVLLKEVLELLVTERSGVYVDGTLGGGGHFRALAEKVSPRTAAGEALSDEAEPVLIGIDRDSEAVESVRGVGFGGLRVKAVLEQSRFSEFDSVLNRHGIKKVRGLFVDLGVSSRQVDEPCRGFMYMGSAPLDMRMEQSGGMTAAEFLERGDEGELAEVFDSYGEVRNAPRLAGAIKAYMRGNKMETSDDLKNCIAREYGKRVDIKLIAKLFQALRIKVNGELDELKTFLDKSVNCLAQGGRIAVISYHSLEDRMVKEFFRQGEAACTCVPSQPICTCNKTVLFKRINRKAIIATKEEIERNPRARSARLRVAERV